MGSKTSLREIEVLVVGAGPAGATAALNLAPTRQVAVVDLRSDPLPRIGESLPPAARRLLTDMGLWESFQAEGHSPCYGNRAQWGATAPFETNFLRDPDGHGWHLDRARFELWLRNIAVDRGAALLAPARLKSIYRDGERWRALLQTAAGSVELAAYVVIDAGGRAAPVARCLGARRRVQDRLVCGYLYGTESAPGRSAGFTYVEAVEDGWWYTAPLPAGRRVLAFHTDADLPGARSAADPNMLLEWATANRDLSDVLSESCFTPTDEFGFTAAHSAVLRPAVGPGWCAVGDAALSFDPLSAQGLLNALFTGLAVAEAADRYFSGDGDALLEYLQTIQRVHQAYRQHLIHCYRAENRWSRSPFWQRRQSILS
jgi:flavin-dependent dehydrogenase